jgi:hypothetical protein
MLEKPLPKPVLKAGEQLGPLRRPEPHDAARRHVVLCRVMAAAQPGWGPGDRLRRRDLSPAFRAPRVREHGAFRRRGYDCSRPSQLPSTSIRVEITAAACRKAQWLEPTRCLPRVLRIVAPVQHASADRDGEPSKRRRSVSAIGSRPDERRITVHVKRCSCWRSVSSRRVRDGRPGRCLAWHETIPCVRTGRTDRHARTILS